MALHDYLKAWRCHSGLSQEAVGAKLGVKHTTIGRWEKGTMALSTADLERLAAVYGATGTQIFAPPQERDLVERLDRVQGILTTMDPEALEHWLAIGRSLARR
jgi:transcriptional regulator with XRE-family HTH domain